MKNKFNTSAEIVVDIAVDEILSPEEYDNFYNICKRKNISMYSDEGLNELTKILSDEQISKLYEWL